MKRNRVVLLLVAALFSITSEAQQSARSINGRITDAEDGNPIPGVTVFFSNTSAGTTTDVEGKYKLNIPGEGSYRLSISHVGYQSVVKDIDPGKESIEFNTALKILELDEVTVSKRIKTRRMDIALFWETLLGKQPSKKAIHVVNPDAVYYFYNADTRILTVTCREPLQIVNYETGYHIHYLLGNFTHDYNTNITDWSYQYNFTELIPENLKQKNTWERNRNEVYQVSLTKFVKSLYHNKLMEDGFLLTYPQREDVMGNLRNPFEQPEVFLTIDSISGSKKLFVPRGLKDLLLICFGEPITPKMLTDVTRDMDFNSPRAIVSAGNRKPPVKNKWSDIGLVQNILETPKGAVEIFPDGTHKNPLKMSSFNNSMRLNGLSLMLPSDYVPTTVTGISMSLFADNEAIGDNEFFFQTLTDRTDSVNSLFREQLEVYPQEKIHLHTDRDVYICGEKIGFKAYVADALTHRPTTNSRYVYAELISPTDTLINRVMVRSVDGMFYGYLPLTKLIPAGNYTLRAYTRYMENMGDDYFFKKNIRIENLSVANKQQRSTADKAIIQDDYEVSFFPEGGNLPVGVLSRIAFKALNSQGYPETITGTLVDETGRELVTIETLHAGMGVVAYTPEAGKRVFLKCRNLNGLEKQFELPLPEPFACSLAVQQSDSNLMIKVNRSIHASEAPCYILAHCRETLFFSEWDHKKDGVLYEKEDFPTGIIQFILFDEQMNPVSERLVFNKNDENLNLTLQTDKEFYQVREKIVSKLFLTDLSGNPLSGNFSVSITDVQDAAVDSSTTILSSLLLSSELRGYIENPAWYLQDNPQSAIALDYLMLTHGWRRYAIPEVVKGNLQYPSILFQQSMEISGLVKDIRRSRPVADAEVSILMKDGGFGLTATDETGAFRFYDFEFPDSTSFYLQASDRKAGSQVEIVLNDEKFPALFHAMQSPTSSTSETGEETQPDFFIAKAKLRVKYDEDIQTIYLQDVVITARKIDRSEDLREQFWANMASDATIRRESFEKRVPQSVAEILRTVPGVQVEANGSVFIRTGDMLGLLPLVVIDGIPFEWVDGISPLESVKVEEVESIDVLKGNSAIAAFGSRGGGRGVISITTNRRGSITERQAEDKYNATIYTPLGYQKPVEFYSPKYETLGVKTPIIPDYRTTIFWKPDIILSGAEEATFEFYTSNFPTTYSVVIEGLTTDGRIIRQTATIRVD